MSTRSSVNAKKNINQANRKSKRKLEQSDDDHDEAVVYDSDALDDSDYDRSPKRVNQRSPNKKKKIQKKKQRKDADSDEDQDTDIQVVGVIVKPPETGRGTIRVLLASHLRRKANHSPMYSPARPDIAKHTRLFRKTQGSTM